MKNIFPWVLVILLALVLAWLLFMKPETSSNDDYQIPVGDTAYEKDNESGYPLNDQDAHFEKEAEWASAGGNDMPHGWVTWTDSIVENPVKKFGPSKTNASYMVQLKTSMIKLLDDPHTCIGDSEVALCAVGTDPEVLRYFEVKSYYY